MRVVRTSVWINPVYDQKMKAEPGIAEERQMGARVRQRDVGIGVGQDAAHGVVGLDYEVTVSACLRFPHKVSRRHDGRMW